MKPKHVISCDEYHAHTRLGIGYELQVRCCSPNCPACEYERQIKSQYEELVGVEVKSEPMNGLLTQAFDALVMAGRIASEATQSERSEHWYHALECVVGIVDDVTEISPPAPTEPEPREGP